MLTPLCEVTGLDVEKDSIRIAAVLPVNKIDVKAGSLVRMKKRHPCGSDLWEVTRTGADFGMRCKGCGRFVMLPRKRFERSLKELVGWTDESGGSDG